MAELSEHERAEIMADQLGINPSSFSGRDKDAIIAMALLKGSFQGGQPGGAAYASQHARDDMLYTIYVRMNFQQTNPAFVDQIHSVMADIIADPGWRPGSLSNEDLFAELRFWKTSVDALTAIGAPSVGGALGADAKSSLKAMGTEIGKPGATLGSVASAGKMPFAQAPHQACSSGVRRQEPYPNRR